MLRIGKSRDRNGCVGARGKEKGDRGMTANGIGRSLLGVIEMF